MDAEEGQAWGVPPRLPACHNVPAVVMVACCAPRCWTTPPTLLSTAALGAAMGRAAASFIEDQSKAAGNGIDMGLHSGAVEAAPPAARLWHSTTLDQLLWVLRR